MSVEMPLLEGVAPATAVPPSEGESYAEPATTRRGWYVSRAGDDSGDGSPSAPFATGAKAASAAAPGDVIFLLAGVAQDPGRFGAPQGVTVLSIG